MIEKNADVEESVPQAQVKKTGKFDPLEYRKDFPILDELVHGKPLVYLELSLSPDGQLVVDQQKEVDPKVRLEV